MKEQDIEKAVKFTKKFLQDIVDEKILLDKLIITKSLKNFIKIRVYSSKVLQTE